MTEDEKRQQKAMLLLEYHDVEQNLCHLEAKASGISRRLSAISDWLERASKRQDPIHDTVYSSKLGSGEVNILTDPQVRAAMDFDGACQLVAEIKAGRQRVNELYKQKQSLGLK